jgi:phosphoglycolate phosphatase
VFADRIVRHFALAHHFGGVYGPELDGRLDDKADLLRHLLATEGLDPTGAVIVGDRYADILAGSANGVRAIGVLWGYGSRQELLDAGATAVCAAPGDLPACVTRVLGMSG